jgi:DNA-binding transcriptional ArsR family regulator
MPFAVGAKISDSLVTFRYFFYSQNMETKEAIKALAALAQEHRLHVFRLLVRHAPHGLPAGHIAAQVGIPASTMSAHLAQLARAGLLRSWREQRRILYAVETEGIRQLVTFLTEDCCGGRPELCGYATPASACQGQDSACCALPKEHGAE